MAKTRAVLVASIIGCAAAWVILAQGRAYGPPLSPPTATASIPATTTLPAGATVKVAAVQFMSDFGQPEKNRKRLETLVRQAAGAGARIVVLPETAITGYTSFDLKTTWQLEGRKTSPGLAGVHPKTAAETVPGESTRALARLAGELGIYLTIPLVEVDPKTGRYFNTIVLAGPKGETQAHYRKLNPWPYAERSWTTRGDRGLQYVDTPYGRLGLLVCYDINFEPPRLREAGVDTLLYCIAWVDRPGSKWFAENLPGIARANGLNIIGANWIVPEKPAWSGYGQSLIIDHTGKTLARVKDDLAEEIIYADLPVPAEQVK